MFGKIASRYDLTNSCLSLLLHKFWNKQLVQQIKATHTLLDLCAGTGEIAFRWLKRQSTPKAAILLDFCPEMLKAAEEKVSPYLTTGHHVRFVQADATDIPLSSESVDAVSIAYGIRNVVDTSLCFQEVFRVLRPQGQFLILNSPNQEIP